jgi:hypothetical protein
MWWSYHSHSIQSIVILWPGLQPTTPRFDMARFTQSTDLEDRWMSRDILTRVFSYLPLKDRLRVCIGLCCMGRWRW